MLITNRHVDEGVSMGAGLGAAIRWLWDGDIARAVVTSVACWIAVKLVSSLWNAVTKKKDPPE